MSGTFTRDIPRAEFLAFARTKPADEVYGWFHTEMCPGAQFLQFLYPDKFCGFGSINGTVYSKDWKNGGVELGEVSIDGLRDANRQHAIRDGEWSWGALVARLEAMEAADAQVA